MPASALAAAGDADADDAAAAPPGVPLLREGEGLPAEASGALLAAAVSAAATAAWAAAGASQPQGQRIPAARAEGGSIGPPAKRRRG
jgi:hypothetical protein